MVHDEFEKIDLKRFVCRNAAGLCKRWSQKEKTETEGTQQQTQQLSPSQKKIEEPLLEKYSKYIGKGTLGGLSDLEQNALNMLKSADVWGPLTQTGTGLLTGTIGAQETTPEEAAKAFAGSVEQPTLYNWQNELLPSVKEAAAGPGYWGSAKADMVRRSAEDVNTWLGGQRANWMWNTDQSNKAIQESKAGRALSALTAYPSSALGWASGISNIGRNSQQILNRITDPEVLQVLFSVMNLQPTGQVSTSSQSTSTTTPNLLQQASNWLNFGTQVGGALSNDTKTT